jgi:PPOX class probable F420-dependent enzyme
MAERLADPRIQRFLATREVLVLATLDADGGPLAMPMWFLPDPDALTLVTEAGTYKVDRLRRDPRCCAVAEAGRRGDIRGVTVRGRAEFLPESEHRRSLVARLVARYHPDLERRWGGRVIPPDRVVFRVVPDRVRSWGLPS